MKIAGIRLSMVPAQVLHRFNPRFKIAQEYLDNEVLKDSTPYVPMRTGNLMQSGIRGTKIGSGEVIWNAPYARSCYYALHRNFRKDLHPQATAQWFEKAKAAKGKNWTQGVQKTLKG